MIKTIPQAIDDIAISLGAAPSAEIPTVAQALENVYTALGGTRTDLDTLVLPEVIDLVAPLIQGGGGGGVTFPTFTENNDKWSCDLTYAQTYAVFLSDGLNGVIPCSLVEQSGSKWVYGYYSPNDEQVQSSFEGVPETVNYGFRVVDTMPKCYFADNGICYGASK